MPFEFASTAALNPAPPAPITTISVSVSEYETFDFSFFPVAFFVASFTESRTPREV